MYICERTATKWRISEGATVHKETATNPHRNQMAANKKSMAFVFLVATAISPKAHFTNIFLKTY